MDLQAAFDSCERIVRNSDPDRYFSALFAPDERRPLLFALYAFNHEIARIAETVREPMLGEIRLQWWREALEAACEHHHRNHDVVHALVDVFARVGPPLDLFEEMIDARQAELGDVTFADMAAFENYLDRTSGNVMRLAARILGAEDAMDAQAREAGIAYGIAGVLRALPFQAWRGKIFLPGPLLARHGISREEIFAGRQGDALKNAIAELAALARDRLAALRPLPKPGHFVSALMPAASVSLYLRKMTAPGFDPLHHKSDVALFRRQISWVRAALTGRI